MRAFNETADEYLLRLQREAHEAGDSTRKIYHTSERTKEYWKTWQNSVTQTDPTVFEQD